MRLFHLETYPAEVGSYEGLSSDVKAAEALQAEDVDLSDDLMCCKMDGPQLGHQPCHAHNHRQVGSIPER